MLENAHPLVKITIVPRGQALGAAWYQPHERQITTKEQLLDEMCSTLGGRASEEITFGRISTGALNDLERVTKQAFSMIAYYGMSEKLGNLSFFDSTGRNEYQFQKPFSEQTGELIDREVKDMVTNEYIRAKKILKDNLEGMNQLAELLLEKEVIYYDDAEKILGKRDFNDEYEEEVQKIRQRNIERLKHQKEETEKRKQEEENKNNEKLTDSEK